MIRVGFICDIFELGGQEGGCLEVLRRIDRKRFKPYLYTFRPGSLLSEVKRLGIPVVVGHNKPAADLEWTDEDRLARKKYYAALVRKLRVDAIDVCLVYAWREGIRAAQDAGVKAIVERVDGFGLISRIRDKSGCQRIICQSKTIRGLLLAQRSLLQCRREQLVVIPNGIDLNRFDPSRYDRIRCRAALGLAPDDFVVGAVARLAPQKNLVHLLQAVQLLIAKTRGARPIEAIIAGPDGGSRSELEAEAARLGIAGRVRFIGRRSDVPEVLRALDAFAITSWHEGTPFALLEAMAMGLPIVASQVGSIPETIDGNGFLVCVLDPGETCDALADLLGSPELAMRLGARSRRLAIRYDVERMVRGYESVLLDALAQSKTSRRSARTRTNLQYR
ncbi:MAG TPA: glycosyltransferase [Candidatus Binataceae bacterium]